MRSPAAHLLRNRTGESHHVWHSLRTTLRFESLERKQMLAGDVVVSLSAATWSSTATTPPIRSSITSGDEAGSFVIQGLEGTVVKLAGSERRRRPRRAWSSTGVRGHVNVSLGDGDDARDGQRRPDSAAA